MPPFLKVKRLDVGNYVEHYLTLELTGIKDSGEIARLYGLLYSRLRDEGIKVVFEKVFGRLDFKRDFLNMRDKLTGNFVLESPPLLYIEGFPISGSFMSSILVYGISGWGPAATVSYYKDRESNETVGTMLTTGTLKSLYLCGIGNHGHAEKGVPGRFDSFFWDIHEHIENNGFRDDSIVRTWFYLKDIYEDYESFNEARKHHYQRNGIDYGPHSNDLPASTCIEGRASKEASVCADVYCVNRPDGGQRAVRRVFNTMQSEADGVRYPFGPTFSRGMLIEDDSTSEIQISGTSSIGQDGQTLFTGDPRSQIRNTISNVKNLLQPLGFTLDDICFATCIFKQPRFYAYYREIAGEMELPDFPCSYAVGNVCRDALSFELDGMAKINKKGMSGGKK